MSISILQHLTNSLPLRFPKANSNNTLFIGVDNGNNALKTALVSPQGTLCVNRVPVAIEVAQTSHLSQQKPSYQVDRTSAIWIGSHALDHKPQALRVGSTTERFIDPRQFPFLAGGVVESLIKAGYQPGTYSLCVGWTVPNNEYLTEDANGLPQLDPHTLQTIREQLVNQTFTVKVTAQDSANSNWHLTITDVFPLAQSMGSFYTWALDPFGALLQSNKHLYLLDIGGGDLQETNFVTSPLEMYVKRLGDGVIAIAKDLQTQFPKLLSSDALAQNALITKTVRQSGSERDITNYIQEAIDRTGAYIVGQLTQAIGQEQAYVVFTGGGTILLRSQIDAACKAAGRKENSDYIIAPAAYATTLNAIGALFVALWQK